MTSKVGPRSERVKALSMNIVAFYDQITVIENEMCV